MSVLAIPVCGAQPQEARALEADWAAEGRGRAGSLRLRARAPGRYSGEPHHIWYVIKYKENKRNFLGHTAHASHSAHERTVCAHARRRARARARLSLSPLSSHESRASCPRCTCPAAARPRRARAVRTPVHKGKTYIKRNTVYIRPRPWLPSGMRHGARHWAGYTHIWNSSLRQRQAERPAHCLLVF